MFWLLIIIGFASHASSNDLIIGSSTLIKSKVLNETRKIFVSLPEGYEETEVSYPVLYFSDGQAHFEIMASAVRFLTKADVIPPLILVGIETSSNRVRDLTPTVYDEEEKNHPWFKSVNYGGAERFLSFIEQELIHYINKNYRTADFKVFSGHSFGGLFSVYSYINKPDLFDGYMAISPSLGWDKERLVNEIKLLLAQNKLPRKSFYISKGNEQGTTGNAFQSLISVIETSDTEEFSTQVFPDENHLTVVFDAHFHGLKAIFSDWQLSYRDSAKGMEFVKNHTKKVKEAFKLDFISQRWFVNLGTSEFYKKNYENAIEAYQLNLSLFPDSAYTHFQLGKVYEAQTRFKLAFESYSRANKLASESDALKSTYMKKMGEVKEML